MGETWSDLLLKRPLCGLQGKIDQRGLIKKDHEIKEARDGLSSESGDRPQGMG